MKTLYLVRHAKSSWDDPTMRDFDRPLNERGKKDAPLMGTILRKLGVLPHFLLSSPAKRAKRTAKKLAMEIGYPKENIATSEELYHAVPDTLLAAVKRLPADSQSAMLVGHNPGLTEFASWLCRSEFDNIPTCGIVCINFTVDSWREVNDQNGTLQFFEFPKKYK